MKMKPILVSMAVAFVLFGSAFVSLNPGDLTQIAPEEAPPTPTPIVTEGEYTTVTIVESNPTAITKEGTIAIQSSFDSIESTELVCDNLSEGMPIPSIELKTPEGDEPSLTVAVSPGTEDIITNDTTEFSIAVETNVTAGTNGSSQPDVENKHYSFLIKRAPEIPSEPLKASGAFLSLVENTLVINQNPLLIITQSDADGKTSTCRTPGKEIEVLVSPETKVYREVYPPLPEASDEPGENTEAVIQSIAEVKTLADLTEKSFVQVWGEEQDGKLLASLIVYNEPTSMLEETQTQE